MSADSTQQVCPHHYLGRCNYGERCRYRHNNPPGTGPVPVCQYFGQGTCFKGAKCPFQHILATQPARPPHQPAAPQVHQPQPNLTRPQPSFALQPHPVATNQAAQWEHVPNAPGAPQAHATQRLQQTDRPAPRFITPAPPRQISSPVPGNSRPLQPGQQARPQAPVRSGGPNAFSALFPTPEVCYSVLEQHPGRTAALP